MSESKSFLDDVSDNGKPESFAEEKFEKVPHGSRRKAIIGAAAALIILAGAFTIYYISTRISMPDLVGKTLVEATDWAAKNDMTLYAKNVYSLDVETDIILSQETAAGQTVRKNTTVTIEVSLGADPDEVIAFPDIESMTLDDINAWIEDNQLTGTKVTTDYSDIIAENQVISYEFTDGSEDSFKRKNRLTITVSLGSETLSDTVEAADFSAMKAGEVLQWGADNGIAIILEEAFDDYVSAGNVISQSVKANSDMLRTDEITVVISLGKSIIVPDFSGMTKDDASTWARENNITLTVVERYSDTKAKGVLYGQSIAADSSIVEGDTIKINYSLGKASITNFVGKTKIDILNWQSEINSKYANIALNFIEGYGDKGSAGKILSQSISNDYVSTTATINVVLSKGMKVVVPDFSGKTQQECSMLANNAGVSILFDYQAGTSVSNGYFISQSVVAYTITTDAQTVTVVISVND